jgi:hypothetical protein
VANKNFACIGGLMPHQPSTICALPLAIVDCKNSPFNPLLNMQILIKFADKKTEQRALGRLIPRFSGKSWATGETAVPAPALSFLAEQGIQFAVLGPAPYELITPLRSASAVGVQCLDYVPSR